MSSRTYSGFCNGQGVLGPRSILYHERVVFLQEDGKGFFHFLVYVVSFTLLLTHTGRTVGGFLKCEVHLILIAIPFVNGCASCRIVAKRRVISFCI